ncbi:MAG TPA: hypothetical protein VNY05_37860 [Candidatus Acidoferrales bacterium]|jgi:hypothetical protein|nr:hypothetical protein [Candidatus Acidoferrales bacterium]
MTRLDTETLQAALVGCQHQIDDIHARMAEIRAALGVKTPRKAGAASADKPKRKISAAGRARIAAAQRKRWAESRPQGKAASKPAKAKRRLSAAGRAAIIAATKKRWAALRAEKASQSGS